MEKKHIEIIEKIVGEITPELKQLALDIHANPELGMEEVKACQWQCELLEKYGFEVEKGFCDIATAYKAVYKGNAEGPKIAMLAEYDALPELGHGCGHNLIAMMSVGSGIAIKEFVDLYGGEIHVIGTPAEETVGGKVAMTNCGAFDGYDVAMMAHPFQENDSTMNTMAIIGRSYEFFGKTSHAAHAPYAGLNALDAMINFFNLISAFRQQTKDEARFHGVISDGGLAPNVIPDYTRANFYIRANTQGYAEELERRIAACAEGAALGTGTTVKISQFEVDFKDTVSNMYLNELACQQIEKFGQVIPRRGTDVLPGSSDMGDVSHACPAIQLGCGMGPMEGVEAYEAHTSEFAQMACSEQAMNNCLDFVKGFALTAVELLTNPEHLQAIKTEFNEK